MESADYTKIFEDSLNEIYIFSANTLKFINVNRGARENLGYTLEQLRELTPLDIKPEHTPESFQQLIAPLRAGEKERIVFETVHQRSDGTIYPVEVHLQISSLDDEQVYMAIILDITERKQAEKSALELSMQRERVKLIHNFVQDASHDFRTPLSILSMKGHLLSKSGLTERQQQHVDGIMEQIKRIENLVSGLNELSEVELTENVEYQSIPLNLMLQEVSGQLKGDYLEKNIQIRFKLEHKLPDIQGDYELLRRAIFNVLQNACDFNKEGGEINIHTLHNGAKACIEIQDTGIGISEEDLPHVFEHMYRADKARAITGGRGVGLSIVNRIIELHGGRIDIYSQLDQGTRVVIQLPILAATKNGRQAAD